MHTRDLKALLCELGAKILIVGRSGSGKDTLAQYCTDIYGLIQLLSATTRQPRYDGEPTHLFVSNEEAETMTDRVAETTINGNLYFATRQQFEECDIYIVDPIGLDCVAKNCKDTPLIVIYTMKDESIRLEHAMARGSDPESEKSIFEKRNADEDEQFSEFESNIVNGNIKKIYPNIKHFFVLDNNSSLDDFYKRANDILDSI